MMYSTGFDFVNKLFFDFEKNEFHSKFI